MDDDDRWFKSLPQDIQNVMTQTDELLSDFAGNVRMAEALNRICFLRVIENSTPIDGETPFFNSKDMSVAVRANEAAARMKEQRIRMLDEFSDRVEKPTPALIRHEIITPTAFMNRQRLEAVVRNPEELGPRQPNEMRKDIDE